MHIEEFVKQTQEDLDNFKSWYLANCRNEGVEIWPIYMNDIDWFEHFILYDQEVDSND